ncbi:FadR/GntR family transcriptional regulator [Ottowia thiooxydans]|uniref:FadR/GntR family transcriptional regulator n=1 Tax=Ottowia thiooxydans TaxID=219182 RepID=UPI0003F7557B|nr:FCD domain-containing protein [Ottowia thiooxydans]
MNAAAESPEEKQKISRPGSVQDALVRMIALADAREETKLPKERELAEQLGIGRPLVREELSKLESLHIVTRRQGSGLYIVPPARRSPEALVLTENVTPLSASSIADAMAVRALLETETARLAAHNHQQIHLDRMAIEIEELERCGSQGDDAARADEAFHRTLAAASGNGMLSQMLELFLRLSWRRRKKYFEQAERGRESIIEHKEILAAVQLGDPDQAASAIRKHMGSAERFWETEPKGNK